MSAPALRSFLARVTALCVVVACYGAMAPAASARRAPQTGLRAVAYAKVPPDFTFDDGTGPEALTALAGKPVVLNFWATWCEPCRDELDAFEKLRANYGDAVRVLTISGEAPGVARAFLRERNIDLPVVEDATQKIFAAYSVSPIPVTLVLRPDLTVSYVSIGQITWAELRGAVDAASDLTPPVSRATVKPNASTP